MTADVKEEEFVSGQLRPTPAHPPSVMRRARTHLWNTFSDVKMKAGVCVYMVYCACCKYIVDVCVCGN